MSWAAAWECGSTGLKGAAPAAQAAKEGLARKIAERQADLQAKRVALAAADSDNDSMRARIAAQTISRDDVIRMNHERCARAPPARLIRLNRSPAILECSAGPKYAAAQRVLSNEPLSGFLHACPHQCACCEALSVL